MKRGEGSHNAKPAVIVGIQKQPGVNTLELTRQLDATLEDVQRALPRGMHIHRDLFRQADFIEQSLNNLFTAFIEGAALVILVVVVPDEPCEPRSSPCWHCRCRLWPRSLRWTALVSRSIA
jgi:multidrug efflux pump subunit AcrB